MNKNDHWTNVLNFILPKRNSLYISPTLYFYFTLISPYVYKENKCLTLEE